MSDPIILYHPVPAATPVPPLSIALDTSPQGRDALLCGSLGGPEPEYKDMRMSIQTTLAAALAKNDPDLQFIHATHGVPPGTTAVATTADPGSLAQQLQAWAQVSSRLTENAKQVKDWWDKSGSVATLLAQKGSSAAAFKSKRGQLSLAQKTALVSAYTLLLAQRIDKEADQFMDNVGQTMQAAEARAELAMPDKGSEHTNQSDGVSGVSTLLYPFKTVLRRLSSAGKDRETLSKEEEKRSKLREENKSAQIAWKDMQDTYFGSSNANTVVPEVPGVAATKDCASLRALLRSGRSMLESTAPLVTAVTGVPGSLTYDEEVIKAFVGGIAGPSDPETGVGSGVGRALHKLKYTLEDVSSYDSLRNLEAQLYAQGRKESIAMDGAKDEGAGDLDSVSAPLSAERAGVRQGDAQEAHTPYQHSRVLSEDDAEWASPDWILVREKIRFQIADMTSRLEAAGARRIATRWLPGGASSRSGGTAGGKHSRSNRHTSQLGDDWWETIPEKSLEWHKDLEGLIRKKSSGAGMGRWRGAKMSSEDTAAYLSKLGSYSSSVQSEPTKPAAASATSRHRKKRQSAKREGRASKHTSAGQSPADHQSHQEEVSSNLPTELDPELSKMLRFAGLRLHHSVVEGLDQELAEAFFDEITYHLNSIRTLPMPGDDTMTRAVEEYGGCAPEQPHWTTEGRSKDDLAVGDVGRTFRDGGIGRPRRFSVPDTTAWDEATSFARRQAEESFLQG